ncbi:phosphotransferase [Paenibacillus spongiae]|uniref:Phosphotransferase n=1 Tax=Paenibacillus spongiae TaxID=2909671 RepID=A0ABY5S260_9BACL|nr:phosphotransferase [Paenibacillus spongiae]UVI27951.1 phosphotransferase [Paenibacillus spongiae]
MSTRKNAAPIARRFGIHPIRIIPIQNGVFRLVLPNNKAYALKRMPVSLQRLRWIDRSLLAIRSKGFNRLGWRSVHTEEGRRLFVQMHRGGSLYVLAPWIAGRWPSVQSPGDMRKCGAALARFHLAARGSSRSISGAANMVGKWPAEIRAQHRLMSGLINKSSRIHPLLQKHGMEILGYSNLTQQLLRNHSYQKICRSGRHLIVLCHGDGGPTNFIINNNGMHIIDFETLRVDLRAYELYRMIYNCCKDHRWNFSIAANFLDGYQRVSKLERTDYAMLRALLRFPRTTYLLLHHYRHQKNRNRTLLEKEMLRALDAERRMTSFIKQLDRYSRTQMM